MNKAEELIQEFIAVGFDRMYAELNFIDEVTRWQDQLAGACNTDLTEFFAELDDGVDYTDSGF